MKRTHIRILAAALAALLLCTLAACSGGPVRLWYEQDETGLIPGYIYGFYDGTLYAMHIREGMEDAFYANLIVQTSDEPYLEFLAYRPDDGARQLITNTGTFTCANSASIVDGDFYKMLVFSGHDGQLWRVDGETGALDVVWRGTLTQDVVYTKEMGSRLLVLLSPYELDIFDPADGSMTPFLTCAADADTRFAAAEYDALSDLVYVLTDVGTTRTLAVYGPDGSLRQTVDAAVLRDDVTDECYQLELFGSYVYALSGAYHGALARLEDGALTPLVPMSDRARLTLTGRGLNERTDGTLVFTELEGRRLFFFNRASGTLSALDLAALNGEIDYLTLAYRDLDRIFIPCWRDGGAAFYLYLSVSDLAARASAVSATDGRYDLAAPLAAKPPLEPADHADRTVDPRVTLTAEYPDGTSETRIFRLEFRQLGSGEHTWMEPMLTEAG